MRATHRDVSITSTHLMRTRVRSAITLTRLMEASERRLYGAAYSCQPLEELVATRILDNAQDFRRWEAEHATLMGRVAEERRDAAQTSVLLAGALALIHRKALFEYLRDEEIRGEGRRLLFRQLFGERDYTRRVVMEHGNYLRSAASFLCSQYVGQRLLSQPIFAEPLARYELLYADYFRVYCNLALAEVRAEPTASLRPLALELKQHVGFYRGVIMRLAQEKRPSLPAAH
jgi:hypothetical protein